MALVVRAVTSLRPWPEDMESQAVISILAWLCVGRLRPGRNVLTSYKLVVAPTRHPLALKERSNTAMLIPDLEPAYVYSKHIASGT